MTKKISKKLREDAANLCSANASWWARSGGTDEELASDHWIPFAGRDSDLLAVHGVSGRVFACPHDDNFEVIADSFAAWLDAYAARVEADDYVVEEGFGDYYLATRDRAAEARQADHQYHQPVAHRVS